MAKSEIKGLNKLLKKFETLDKEIIKNVEGTIEGAAQNIEEDAKVAAPVFNGTSGEVAIQFKGKGIREVNIQPRPFLYPAFVKHRKILIKDLKDYLKTLKL